jgi:DNA-binding CsgD family transcriptional regulator
MTPGNSVDSPLAGPALGRTLAAFRSRGHMDIAFGGAVLPDGAGFRITELCNARTRSLANLLVRRGAGLGGKSLLLGRAVSVKSYPSARGITHVYDHAVSRESLETVVAIPVVVDSRPRMVVYLGSRGQISLGDSWFDNVVSMVRRLERDIAVDEEVRRRIQLLQSEAQQDLRLTRADVLDLARELDEVAAHVADNALRTRVTTLRDRLERATRPTHAHRALNLAPREIDVIAEISLGHSNREVAENLGLLPNTVKSYLKTAMRKLQAHNRVEAIIAARDAGLIR